MKQASLKLIHLIKLYLVDQLVEMDGSEIEVSELIQETPFSLFLFYRGPW